MDGLLTHTTSKFVTGFQMWWKLSPKVHNHESSEEHLNWLEKWKTLSVGLRLHKTIDAESIALMDIENKRSGVVLIKGPDPQIATRLQFLKQLINDSKPATPTTIHQNHALHHSLASLPNVDHDVTTEEIQNQLAENGHTIKKTLEDQV
ncbi:hypothetical protein CBL_10096 [Carabus blaptoides fortunei]